MKVKHQYRATVLRVIDGDTLEALVDLGLEVFRKVKIRLAGIDCPEAHTDEGKKVTAYVRGLLEDKEVVINTYKKGSFNRWLGTVYLGNLAINPHLIQEGMAVPYGKGSKAVKVTPKEEVG